MAVCDRVELERVELGRAERLEPRGRLDGFQKVSVGLLALTRHFEVLRAFGGRRSSGDWRRGSAGDCTKGGRA